MPLDNTAKLSDIIAALQEMQGINQRADLKSALVAKEIDALDTDSVAELISKLNDANLVLNGKKWASGTVTSQSTKLYFEVLTSTTQDSLYFANVQGLEFKPSVVYMAMQEPNYTIRTYVLDNPLFYVGGRAFVVHNNTGQYKLLNNAYLANGGFQLPANNANVTYNWIAFE